MQLTRRQWIWLTAVYGAGRLWGQQLPVQPEPLFVEVPASASGIAWVHDNAMSASHYLPETLGPGCAFLDFDNDGWMDIYLVNSGPCDFWKPPKPIRNALYKNNRNGTFTDVTEKAGVAGGTFGMGVAVGRLRQRRLAGHVRHRIRPLHSLQEQRRRHIHRCDRQGRRGHSRMDDQRGLVRLRQRRPPGSVRVQFRGLFRRTQVRVRRQQARARHYYCIPRVFKANRQLPLSQQWRWHIYRGQQRHRYRAKLWAKVWVWWRPTSITTAAWTFRRQRHGAELSVRESRPGSNWPLEMGGDRFAGRE